MTCNAALKQRLYDQKSEALQTISRMRAKIAWIDETLGLKHKPRSFAESQRKESLKSIAVKVLRRHPLTWFSGGQVAVKAIKLGLWLNPPTSYRATMTAVLMREAEHNCGWLKRKRKGKRTTLYQWSD